MEDDIQLETQEDAVSLMEELVDRLKLLSYEKEFLTTKGMKPLSPGYFVNSTNATEQFNYFKTLAKWLLQACDMNVSDISKFEDPLTVATNIQTECKRLDIACDFPALKLKSGAG
jgi:estrogen-related receptor beta like 1